MQVTTTPLPANVVSALERGKAIEAVKLLRESTGLGLADAMKAIAQHVGRQAQQQATASTSGPSTSARRTTAAKAAVESRHVASSQSGHRRKGLAPGEVPRTNGDLWLIVALIFGAVVYFHVLR